MRKFKIGITMIGYECQEQLEKVLPYWIRLKENPPANSRIESIKIGFTHGCFEETAKLGFPILSTDGTIEHLMKLKDTDSIDYLQIRDTPQKEYEMWTNGFQTFKDDIDLLWMLNTDEFWELDEIENVLKYIENNDLLDFYKVNFKNFCIDEDTWIDDFIVPRIWWAKKQGGIKRFYQDDLLEYNNGKKDVQCSHLTIPPSVAFPKHYSWVGSKAYLQRKLNFQKLRYGGSSYRWNDITDKLELNDDYYRSIGKPKPTLNKS